MDIGLLQNSCRRLPQLVVMEAPSAFIVAELQVLTDLALEALRFRLHAEYRKELEARRSLCAMDDPTRLADSCEEPPDAN